MNNDEPVQPAIDPVREGWSIHPDAGFIDQVGPIWERAESGTTRYGFIAEPRHANLLGVVQGGMLMTLADRALGLQAWHASGNACVTVRFDMEFLAATRIGEFVEVTPELVGRAGSLVFLRGVVLANSRPVAAVSGVWKQIPSPRG